MQGAAIGFDEYMHHVLYTPSLGYYNSHGHKFSERGDFTTAPESSPLYGACLATQCQEVLDGLPKASILELGAGSGILAVTLLQCLEQTGTLPEYYLIFEPSTVLRQRQQALLRARLPQQCHRVQWLHTLPARPFNGIILANEVIDALPVCRFIHAPQGVLEQRVGLDAQGNLCWVRQTARESLQAAVSGLLSTLPFPLPHGYCSEINLHLTAWLSGLAACLREGVLLFVDYGCPRREYYHAQRIDGTLLCYYRHRVHADPFFFPGLQDITAWVDFTALALAARECGLHVHGYTTQAWFLLANGLQEAMERAAKGRRFPWSELSRQAKVLSLPGEMGECFKVLALSRGYRHPLRGFALRDQRHFL